MHEVMVAKEVKSFGHKVGWAKGHGLISPEFESKIITMLAASDLTEKEADRLLHGMMVLQCGIWVRQLEKFRIVRKEVSEFLDRLVAMSLLTPLQAYDLARRTIEGEYNEDDLLSQLKMILGAVS